jgi:hypothetical protein
MGHLRRKRPAGVGWAKSLGVVVVIVQALPAILPTLSSLAMTAWAKSREAGARYHELRQATLPTLRATAPFPITPVSDHLDFSKSSDWG